MKKSNLKYRLPKGWIRIELGAILNTATGGTPDRNKLEYFDGTIPWVKSGELNYNIIYQTEERLTEAALNYSNAKIFPVGTLLIALYGTTVGRLAFLGISAATNQAVCGIFNNNYVNLKYIYYFLMFQQPYLITQTSGGAQSNISQTIVRKTLVPLPPLKEQKRIVAKINELLDDLETGKTKLETALAKLKTYRQSVLKEAFEGRLINKQLKRSELPIGWQALRFKEIGKLVSGQHILKMDYDYSKKGIPYLTGPADFGIQNPIITKWTTKPKVIANKNDVLITVKGSGVGKINLLNIDTAAIGRQLMALSSNQIESRFLFLYLQSQFEKFQSLGSGSSIPGIDRNTILNFIIPIPPLKTQVEVVKEIESRFSNCDRMEKITIERIKQIGSLRQSILQNAFEGKLVEQNPSDEPVELLIGKIKREKEIFLAEEKIKRKKSPKNFKINMMTKKLETIIHLLQKNKKPISSRTLWKSSEHSDDIDAFYAQLKKHVDKGEIKEIRKGKDSFLTIAK